MMEDSYNLHDYNFTGKFDILTEDVFVINPVGMYWKNKAQVVEALQILGNIRLKYESVKYSFKDIRVLTSVVAVAVVFANGVVNEDYNFPDGSKGGSKGDITDGIYSFTLTKKSGAWKISSMHITHVDAHAAAMNPIKN
jgi:hypothetical protein